MRQHVRPASILTALIFSLLVTATAGQARAAEGRKTVNVNSADVTQLALLPRVGMSVAQRVIDFRKQNGPFKKLEDLMLVRGIGEKTFQLIKPYVALAGETSLHEKVHASRTKKETGGKEAAPREALTKDGER